MNDSSSLASRAASLENVLGAGAFAKGSAEVGAGLETGGFAQGERRGGFLLPGRPAGASSASVQRAAASRKPRAILLLSPGEQARLPRAGRLGSAPKFPLPPPEKQLCLEPAVT